MNNDALYLEADEEITAAIDKMQKNPSAQVKIVVPKRSTLLQSVVNLKLLKKAADDAGKKLILVTGDRTSTHLAGQLGLSVAATLTSQTAVPETKQPAPDASDEIEAEDEAEDASDEAAAEAPIVHPTNKPSETKPLLVRKPISPDEPVAEAAGAAAGVVGAGGDGSKVGGKKSRVPDFNRMQKRLMWGGLAVAVIIILLVVNYFITSATVTLFAQGSKIDASFGATIDPVAKTTNPTAAVVAATNLQSSHSLSETVSATGTKDVGTKASGSVTVSNCADIAPTSRTIPMGTAFKSADGKVFISNTDVAVPGGTGNFITGCTKAGTATVTVTASQNGDQYNLASGTSYTVSGQPSQISATGGQMSGGTSKVVNVVTQADVDKAKAELLAKDKDTSQKDLENKAGSGNRAIVESFAQTAGDATASPAVGTQADQTAVSVQASYSELAVANSDLENVLKAQELKQVGPQNQIYDDGLSNLQITAVKNNPGAASTFTLATSAYGGVKLDVAKVAASLVGKRYGDAADAAAKLPGIEKAEVTLSPPWATSLPHIAGHIHVQIKVIHQ